MPKHPFSHLISKSQCSGAALCLEREQIAGVTLSAERHLEVGSTCSTWDF